MAAPRLIQLIAGAWKSVLTIGSSAGAGDAFKVPSTGADGYLDESLLPGGGPIDTSSGAPDAAKIVKTNDDGVIDPTLMPPGTAPDVLSVEASEDIAAPAPVNIWNNGGTLNVRKADATATGKRADGWIIAAATNGNPIDVYFGSRSVGGFVGLTIGADHFLDTTAGQITDDVSGYDTGNVVQRLGKASSATTIEAELSDPVELG